MEQASFSMTYFSIDPKPQNFTHPNGIKGIKKIVFKIGSSGQDTKRAGSGPDSWGSLEDENENGIVEVIFNRQD